MGHYPGAWAGAVVFVDKELGIIVLTSQEKWDRLKLICKKWLTRVEAGELDLNHSELRSDKDFMVHATQAYPGMKPYLKGFHLSMETWQGGRDEEGWKLPPGALIGPEELESMDEGWYRSPRLVIRWMNLFLYHHYLSLGLRELCRIWQMISERCLNCLKATVPFQGLLGARW